MLLPSITRRIDDFLLVKELNTRLFDNAITDEMLHIALCAPSTGVEYDYERLELLGKDTPSWTSLTPNPTPTGDAFLKYVSSVYLFVTQPTQAEGVLHMSRQKIISNRILFQAASQVGLPQYIQAQPVTFKGWSLPNSLLENDSVPTGGDNDKMEVTTITPQYPTGQIMASGSRRDEQSVPIPSETESSGGKKVSTQNKKKRTKGGPKDAHIQWLGDKVSVVLGY